MEDLTDRNGEGEKEDSSPYFPRHICVFNIIIDVYSRVKEFG